MDMFKQPVITVLFYLGLLVIIGFAVITGRDIKIDTDLRDLNPENADSETVQAAIDASSAHVQQRLLFLVTGADQQTIGNVAAELSKELATLPDIDIVEQTPTLEQIRQLFGASRHHLLTETQKQRLQTESAEQLAEQAKDALYQLSGTPRIYDFKQDPTGWHGEYVVELLETLSKHGATKSDEAVMVSARIRHGALDSDVQQQLLPAILAIEKSLQQRNVEILHNGVFFYASDAAKHARQDISLISTGSAIGVTALLFMTFRSFWPIVLPVISILLGMLFAFAATHLIYGKVHILTIVFGVSLIGIVIDYALHYFFHSNAVQGSTHRQKLIGAMLLSLTTSLIGYSALSLSHLEALSKVAVFSCAGLLMAWLTVMYLAPKGARRIQIRHRPLAAILKGLDSAIRPLSKGRTAIVIAGVSLMLFAVLNDRIQTSDNPRIFFTPSPQLLQSERRIAQLSNDYEPGRFIIVQGQTPAYTYQQSEHFFDLIKQNTNLKTEDFFSLTEVLPSQKLQQENYRITAKLYSAQGVTAHLLNDLDLPDDIQQQSYKAYVDAANQMLPPQRFLQHFADSLPPLWQQSDQQVSNIILIRKGTDMQALAALAQNQDAFYYYNTIEKTTESLRQQRYSATQLLLAAYAIVLLILLLRYRNWRAAAMVLIPMGATATTLLIFMLFGIEVNLFHSMALFLVLGLGMDYAIFANDLGDHRDITQQAILLSAVTSLLSFGLLGLSSIPLVQSFGLTLLIGNSLNFIGALIFANHYHFDGVSK